MEETAMKALRSLAVCTLILTLILLLSACGEAPAAVPSPTAEPTAELTPEPTAKATPEPSPTPTPVPELTLGEGLRVPEDTEELSLAAESFDYDALLEALPRLKALKTLTLEETALSPSQLEALRRALGKDAELHYSISLVGQVVAGDAETLDLSALQEEGLPELLEKLPLLPALRQIELRDGDGKCALTPEGIAALAECLPEVELLWSARLSGHWIDRDAEEVNLSHLRPAKLDEALTVLKMLPKLRYVELMSASGRSYLEKSDVRRMLKELPEVDVHYEFPFFDQTLSTLDERVEYDHIELTDDDEPAIREALDLLPHCRYFKLDEDRYGIRDEVMASIRDDYPDTKIVWRVFVKTINMLTDEEILRVTFILNDYNSAPLQYCTDAVYLDIGHNGRMRDISFLANMPKLECLILSGSPITNLDPLENCKNLIWLECCFCGPLEDISAIRDHPTLKYLNISYTAVRDISPLENIQLERMVAMSTWLAKPDMKQFEEAHPDCLTAWYGEQPYGYPWRYNAVPANASMFFEYYEHMRQVFIYDDRSYWNNKKSEYGPGYLSLRE